MKKNLHIAPSPLTNRIFCGSVSKDGFRWLSNKTDVTAEACAAVAKHVIVEGGYMTITTNGKPAYRLTASVVDGDDNG